MNQRTRTILGASAISSATLALVFGCVEPVRDVGAEYAPDAASTAPVSFVPPPDASSDGKSDVPVPDVRMCIATECPFPYATCGTGYKCGTNLLTDDAHCGECGHGCPGAGPVSSDYQGLNLAGRCIDGKCELTCPSGFKDCNGLVDDGCEVAYSSNVDNCGGCGIVCPTRSNGTRSCAGGICAEDQECLPPKVWCGTACVDPQNNLQHCGACNSACPYKQPPAGMAQVCQNGECGNFQCSLNRADCNNDITDGCEVTLTTDLNNCGQCGTRCAPGQRCMVRADKGNAVMCSCDPHETFCGANTCVDLLSDSFHCGACGHACPVNTTSGTHSSTSCQNGFCVVACAPGWGDCDGDRANWCETNTSSNPRHCGACGNECAPDQPCIDGVCAMVECESDAGVVTK